MWLTSHQRSTVLLLDRGSPVTSREIFSEDASGRVSPSASSLKISLEILCPVEPLYFFDEKSTIVEQL